MNTLVIGAGNASHGPQKEPLRALRIFGRRLARKLKRKTGVDKVKGTGGLEQAPHLSSLHEENIDISVAQDVLRLVELKCLYLLENFGPTDQVRAAVLERWDDIIGSLHDNKDVGDEIRDFSTAVNPQFSRIMHQIASRLVSLRYNVSQSVKPAILESANS